MVMESDEAAHVMMCESQLGTRVTVDGGPVRYRVTMSSSLCGTVQFEIDRATPSRWGFEAHSVRRSWMIGAATLGEVVAAFLGRFELPLGEPRVALPNHTGSRTSRRPLGDTRGLESPYRLDRPGGGRLEVARVNEKNVVAGRIDVEVRYGPPHGGDAADLTLKIWRPGNAVLDLCPGPGLLLSGPASWTFEELIAMALAVLDERAPRRAS